MTVHALPLKSPTSVTEADLQTPSTLTLVVENMHCGGCLKSVERAAMGVPGVSGARASLAAKRVTVSYDAKLAGEAHLIAALERQASPRRRSIWHLLRPTPNGKAICCAGSRSRALPR